MSVLKIKQNGEWIAVGTGAQGPAGKDGTMTFEDLTAEQKASLKGDPGYTPVKGTDYWTTEDKAEIVNETAAAIPTPDVSGQIGTHNSSTTAHSDIRTAASNAATAASAAQTAANEAKTAAAGAQSTADAAATAAATAQNTIASMPLVHVGAAEPSDIRLLWVDTGNSNLLKFYNGSAWATICAAWAE